MKYYGAYNDYLDYIITKAKEKTIDTTWKRLSYYPIAYNPTWK